MLILTIRTDKPEAEIGLFQDQQQLAYEKWEAHRQLAETIHTKIEGLLQAGNFQLKDLGGLVVFKGPGSFTGLRIGLTVANALAYAFHLPIVATLDEDWQAQGITRLMAGESEPIALPEYGAPPHITPPKH